MKHFIFLILFFVALGWATAAEPIKLNLEVGRTYTIETITHIDTSAQNPFRYWEEHHWSIMPVSFDKATETYRMKAMLSYYFTVEQKKNKWGGWEEQRVYETNNMSALRSVKVLLNANKVPVLFDITTLGAISNFDLSAYELTKTPEGFDLILHAEDKKNIEYSIRGLFLNSAIKSDVVIQKDTNEFQYSKFIVDINTGLIQQKIYNYKYYKFEYINSEPTWSKTIYNKAIYFQKYIPEYSIKKRKSRAFCDGVWIDTLITSANTLIEGQIAKRIDGEDSIDIVIGSKNNQCIRVALDKNNEFKTGLTIETITPIRIQYPKLRWGDSYKEYAENLTKSSCFLDVGAGDSLRLQLVATDSALTLLTANGVFSTVFDVKEEEWKIKKQLIKSNGYLSPDIERFAELLDTYRTKADPRLYLDKLFSIAYRVAFKGDSLIKPTSHDVLINNSLAKTNQTYIDFLYRFIDNLLANQLQTLTGIKQYNQKRNAENEYYMGQIMLEEPVRAYYLADFIKKKMRSEMGAYRYYSSFSNSYYGTPFLEKFKKDVSRNLGTLFSGFAPDFTLKDIYGKKYSLRDFRKKVVVLHFNTNPWSNMWPGVSSTDKLISKLQKVRYNTNNDLVYIFVISANNKVQIAEIKEKKYKGIFLIADDENEVFASKIAFDYMFPENDSEFLLDKNGWIQYSTDRMHNEISDDEIENALSRSYNNYGNDLPQWVKVTGFLLIVALLLIVLAFIIYRIITKRKIQRSELNKRMRELELTAIRAQMNPHFMYNCLNSIQNLVQKNKNEEAHLYLSKFASLIRRTLGTSKKEEISLSEELETIKEYIGLEKLRFDFDVQFVIDERVDLVSIFVPPMLLHPFVENALLHGLLPKPNNRVLKIEISKEVDRICMVIEDNGVGRNLALENGSSGTGRGLELSKERLSLLSDKYQTSFDMTIEDATSPQNQYPGTRVTLCFNDEK